MLLTPHEIRSFTYTSETIAEETNDNRIISWFDRYLNRPFSSAHFHYAHDHSGTNSLTYYLGTIADQMPKNSES